ncbi:GTPase HflX [Candidatus Roizmanbacteria bacterium CG22_combo_CG10-13_8_21_14_all_35_9]|uniref:GTPase HflX n=4 Tax=Candidatus Roizmaniibacteriota TaxID=1752723 RepID=A0A2M8F145_9BACT|nr:MAG: GTPase HflX [Candidatus Roizmanbacteria bacterium CG23_combo_of_CG06-09_8_20_14_all_35_49]PIP62602.1 MAG: GTPase HflX [Candidatus Roizmanbacteria bacterium CG22_combo_CG10-13_8_21_14_all_35_9]PIY70771.1 MAG: GTPase HflX [Candidatus Roizmanbacteria bacterium CG_4_10_14_0_8_um_filter_35_28]PJC33005.1 MAG: GTPase HflX [Candidatus Roizmanbacteria bacterium CG_4_9_14_0_2_um_filter_35_15]PJC82786.1 MAG: GTPase HflX [Candidatus Roizmanbacteria bacterium CG_4_8_14_3_um_filter_35_14]
MKKAHRIILIDVVDPHLHKEDAIKNLEELKLLVETYKGIDVIDIIQHRTHPDKATFIGSGKALELTDIVADKKINIVVVNAIVNPSVLFNLTQILWTKNPDIQVWDRVDLILNIFDLHAHTTEAKLQIEIAQMQHMGPRMYGLGVTYFSRQAGGIGTKGIGETNIELMKRHWRDQIRKKREELEKISRQHLIQLERRKNNNLTSISIVGYTNAGKTSLFNLLTKKKKIVENALFVTLDSVSGRLYLPTIKKETIVSDTIGFIRDLPSSLINSFKSTLMESIHADILLHVIDISDPKMNEKIEIVEKILYEIRVQSKRIIYVFNKIDAYEGDGKKILKEINNKYSYFSPQFISATTNYGIKKLINEIEKDLKNVVGTKWWTGGDLNP